MKKVLVTGCSGYIGSHLCQMMRDKYEVYGLDIKFPDFPISMFNFEDVRDMSLHPSRYDAIVHLAALVRVGESEDRPTDYYTTNTTGTQHVLAHTLTDHFIFASTGAAEFCNSPYAVSKKAAEHMVKEITHDKHTIFRFYNVIGTDGFAPTNPDGLMLKLIEAVKTGEFTIHGNDYETHDGTPIRDYVHVNEICSAILAAIEYGPSNGIECLGHGKGYSVKEIVELFKKVNNVDFEVKYGPRRNGDAPVTILKEVSRFMKEQYNILGLLNIEKL